MRFCWSVVRIIGIAMALGALMSMRCFEMMRLSAVRPSRYDWLSARRRYMHWNLETIKTWRITRLPAEFTSQGLKILSSRSISWAARTKLYNESFSLPGGQRIAREKSPQNCVLTLEESCPASSWANFQAVRHAYWSHSIESIWESNIVLLNICWRCRRLMILRIFVHSSTSSSSRFLLGESWSASCSLLFFALGWGHFLNQACPNLRTLFPTLLPLPEMIVGTHSMQASLPCLLF